MKITSENNAYFMQHVSIYIIQIQPVKRQKKKRHHSLTNQHEPQRDDTKILSFFGKIEHFVFLSSDILLVSRKLTNIVFFPHWHLFPPHTIQISFLSL